MSKLAMMAELPFPAVAAEEAPCKCCGTSSPIFGVTDFNRNCESTRVDPLRPCGVPIYYYRCPTCGLLFATALDRFSHQDFGRWIYNEQYPLIDPEYADKRPRGIADAVVQLFADAKDAAVLDYGSGSGVMAESLRERGFADVMTYDPFVPAHATRPERKFQLVTCFEVVEHATDPRAMFNDLLSFLDERAILFFSTVFQPDDIEQQRMNWWYIAPRNAHVSLYTSAAINQIAQPLGYQLGSFSPLVHVMFRQLPDFAGHIVSG